MTKPLTPWYTTSPTAAPPYQTSSLAVAAAERQAQRLAGAGRQRVRAVPDEPGQAVQLGPVVPLDGLQEGIAKVAG